jgi:tRNA (Thr-GGU) A37 N-methylase
MFTPQPIGFVRSPYSGTKQIPKGLGTKHEAEGVLEIRPEFERGLADIEGFSHLFVIWVFDRSRESTYCGRTIVDVFSRSVLDIPLKAHFYLEVLVC